MPNNIRPSAQRTWKRHHVKEASLLLYDAILKEQQGVCAICKQPPTTRPLTLDFNQATNKIRGLLCHACVLLTETIVVFLKEGRQLRDITEYIQADGEPLLSKAKLDIEGFNPFLVRPYIDFRRQRVQKRFLTLMAENWRKIDVINDVAKEFQLSTRTIRRYIGHG